MKRTREDAIRDDAYAYAANVAIASYCVGADERAKHYKGWLKAVQRSMHWLEEA